MITMLKKNHDGSFDAVCEEQINVGDFLQIGEKDGKAVMKQIEKIIEQRKERGTYVDEKNRRMWAKVS